jgi:hypothetical protein
VARDSIESGSRHFGDFGTKGSAEGPRERESRRVPWRLCGVSHVASRVQSSWVGRGGLRNRE